MTDQQPVVEERGERSGRGIGFWVTVGTSGALVIVMAVVFFLRTDPENYNPRQPQNNPTDGRQIDVATELPYLDGSGMFSFSEIEGQVTVINFWASYCIPCRAEHAELGVAFERYRDRGVRFVGIVYHDEPEAARGFLDEYGWEDGYVYVDDPDGRVTVDFGVYGVPETFFVDEEGIIVSKHFGEIDRTVLFPTLDAILAGQPAG